MGGTFAGRVDPLIPQALRVARMVLGVGTGLAEDAVQEALLRAFRAWPALPDKDRDVWPWLRTIVVREARRLAARQGRRTPLPPEDPLPDPVDDLVAQEERAEAARALAALPSGYRVTAELRYVHGLSCSETAAVLGTAVGTVKWRMHEAHAMVRERLGRQPADDGRPPALPEFAVAPVHAVRPGVATLQGTWPPRVLEVPPDARVRFTVPSSVCKTPAIWVATDRGHHLWWPGYRATGPTIAGVRALAQEVAGDG